MLGHQLYCHLQGNQETIPPLPRQKNVALDLWTGAAEGRARHCTEKTGSESLYLEGHDPNPSPPHF